MFERTNIDMDDSYAKPEAGIARRLASEVWRVSQVLDLSKGFSAAVVWKNNG